MTRWVPMAFIFGVSLEQMSMTSEQRVWNRQPEGGLSGEGISPLNIIGAIPSFVSSGSVSMDADIKARV